MTKSLTAYASKPLGPGPDRFMLQPYSRYSNGSRFAGEIFLDWLSTIWFELGRYWLRQRGFH